MTVARAAAFWACVALVSVALGSSARADARQLLDKDSFLGRLWHAAIAELEATAAAQQPALVPPTPVKIRWRPRRLGSIDLKAPLLALGAGDLDGDGHAELIALTSREVIVLRAQSRARISIVARAALPTAAPSLRPRDPVGTLVVSAATDELPAQVLARSSDSARGVILRMTTGALEELSQSDGFPLCTDGSATLVAGRNYFAPAGVTWQDRGDAPTLAGPFYAAQCNRAYVDPAGHAMSGFAVVGVAGKLEVRVVRTCPVGDAACTALKPRESSISGVGAVFSLADIDGDGRLDVLASSNRPPGDPDRVTVWAARGSRWKPVFSHGFSGGVAGLAVADFDGDRRLEGVAAVRLLGTDRVDLWALN